MSGKVTHISDRAHAEMITYCADHGLIAYVWVSRLILKEIQSISKQKLFECITADAIKCITTISKKETPSKKKKLENYTLNSNTDQESYVDPCAQPPFWSNKGE